jgi:thiamine-monophosphate kinase
MKPEFQLIAAFARRIRRRGSRAPGVVVDVGDDGAVLRASAREDLVATTDAMVEGRHFERRWLTGRELGWRLAAVNLSDLAAMGAAPRFALVSLAIPPGVPERYIEDIERGVVDHLARYGARVVGGNVSSIDGPLVVDLTLLGACARGRAWRRRARPGDAIVVAGVLGAAAAGAVLLRGRKKTGPLVRAYVKPTPRLDVVRALTRSGGAAPSPVHGAIDVSDGLSSDVIHVCEASRVGCEIDATRLPISPAVRAFCRERGLEAVEWALHAGEDYALVLSVPARALRRVSRAIERAGAPASVVGRFTKHRGVYHVIEARGRARTFRARGWDHLQRGR